MHHLRKQPHGWNRECVGKRAVCRTHCRQLSIEALSMVSLALDGLGVQFGDTVEVMQGMIESVQIPEKVPATSFSGSLAFPDSQMWCLHACFRRRTITEQAAE